MSFTLAASLPVSASVLALAIRTNFGAATFGSEAEQVIAALVEGTLMSGLVAQLE